MNISPKLAKGAYNNIDLGKYKVLLKSTIKKLKATAEEPEHVYIHQAHEYASGETTILVCWGKPDKVLKTEVKTKTKKEKKLTVFGKGFVRQEDDGSQTLCIYKAAGNALPNKLFKAGKKLLAYAGIRAIEYLNPENIDLTEDEGDEIESGSVEGENTVDNQAVEQQLLGLLGKYKNALPTIKKILPRLTKRGHVPPKFDGVINITKQIIERFNTAFNGADNDTKAKFQGAFDQMQKLGNVLNGKVDFQNKDVKSEIQQDEKMIRQLNKLLNKLSKKGKKLNVDGLFNRFVA